MLFGVKIDRSSIAHARGLTKSERLQLRRASCLLVAILSSCEEVCKLSFHRAVKENTLEVTRCFCARLYTLTVNFRKDK